MASIEKRLRSDGKPPRRAHHRTPGGGQRNRTFDRKIDAERFLATVESAKSTGSFVDPVLTRITMVDWATYWLDNQTHLKPSTREHLDLADTPGALMKRPYRGGEDSVV